MGRTKPSPQVAGALESASIDVEALVRRVDHVLAEPLYWFPVRHHSPAIARQVAACIRARRPKIIFSEGPREAQEMIQFLGDAKTRPPVAVYSSFRDDSAAAPGPLRNALSPRITTGIVPPPAALEKAGWKMP